MEDLASGGAEAVKVEGGSWFGECLEGGEEWRALGKLAIEDSIDEAVGTNRSAENGYPRGGREVDRENRVEGRAGRRGECGPEGRRLGGIEMKVVGRTVIAEDEERSADLRNPADEDALINVPAVNI